jgi:hypothetical protein
MQAQFRVPARKAAPEKAPTEQEYHTLYWCALQETVETGSKADLRFSQ